MSKNLALGKSVVITPFIPFETKYTRQEIGNAAILTDGNTAQCESNDGWKGFFEGVGREITVDLGEVYAVDGFDAGFLHKREKHIICPENVKLLLSVDGVDFYEVATVCAPYPASFLSAARARYSTTLPFSYRARFAKIVFPVDGTAYCDELRIFGGECLGIEEALSGTPYARENKNRFAARDMLGGAKDMATVCFGMLGERKFAMSREAFLPLLAYIGVNGNPVDTMFDSILFVPAISSPSGGSFGYLGKETVMSDWEYLLDELFSGSKNLCALEDAVGDVKKALSLEENYKLKVYLTAPVPKISFTPFGDLNGDGIEDKLITTDDCVNAYVWFVDNVTRRFNSLNFKNISLEGWMWSNGTFSRRRREDEADFAKKCVSKLHNRGYKGLFMPHFQACGSDKVYDVGFDCAVVSADANFDAELFPDLQSGLKDCMKLCKNYGFGVQIELPAGVSDPEGFYILSKTFDTCLSEFISSSAMSETVHIYNQYCCNETIDKCALSDNPDIRAVYDKLYRFIKGTLTKDMLYVNPNNASAPKAEAASVSALLLDKACFADGAEDNVVDENPAALFDKQENSDMALAEEHGVDFALLEEENKAPLSDEGEVNTLPENEGVNPAPKNNTRESKPQKPKNGGPNPKRSMHPCHKKLAVGAGIAAAAIGVLYVIKKLSDRE